MTYHENDIDQQENEIVTDVDNQALILASYANAVADAINADVAFEKSFDPAWKILGEMDDKDQQKWLLENIGEPIAKRYNCEARLSKVNGSVQFYHKGGIKENRRHDAARKKYAYFIMSDAEKQERLEREAIAKKENALKEAEAKLAEETRNQHNLDNQHLSNEEIKNEGQDEGEDEDEGGEVSVDSHTRAKPQSSSQGDNKKPAIDNKFIVSHITAENFPMRSHPVNCTAHDLGVEPDYSEYKELASCLGVEFSVEGKDEGEIDDYCDDLGLANYALNNISRIIGVEILTALKAQIDERITELENLEMDQEEQEEEEKEQEE